MFEYVCDYFLKTDMQKDFVVYHISSVTLDETMSNKPVLIDEIKTVSVNGKDLQLGGYLDIGLHDTMKDLIVNFLGAVVFSVIGFFYIKGRGKTKFIEWFIPKIKEKENGNGSAENSGREINVGDSETEEVQPTENNGKDNS